MFALCLECASWVGKVAKIARLILVESQFYVSFMFALGFLVGKVAKVAYITGGGGL